MATTTGPPSAAQRRDHRRMGMEKLAAAQEGWTAMGTALLELQQREFARAIRAAWTPWWSGAWPAFDAQRAVRDVDAVIAAGLAPVSRAVGANTRRQQRARRA
ncbi:hypothetical protein H0E84_08455 [Luteimonas sp. SJ-92]|uniref:Uncharacterized protein n=1 Tax=Luteimonas salinisoli TaxID=2752307 RepID=A0A853JB00_9GAMM|nr:hypothetical protein [Luteimonas salinisoli]NZA26416.1 hypothetical protein [Luteimonas salinisoli]